MNAAYYYYLGGVGFPGRKKESLTSSERLIEPLGISGWLLGKRVLSGAVGPSSRHMVEIHNFKYDCFYFNSFCGTKKCYELFSSFTYNSLFNIFHKNPTKLWL